jgi:hypothetical protein
MKTIKQVEGDELTKYMPPASRPRYRDTLKDLTIDIGGELATDVGKGAVAIGKGLFKAVKFIATPKPSFESPERYQPKREQYRPEPYRPASKPKDQASTPKVEKSQQCKCCRCHCHCCHHD